MAELVNHFLFREDVYFGGEYLLYELDAFLTRDQSRSVLNGIRSMIDRFEMKLH